MFGVLYKNRRHLFDETSKEYERVTACLGGLYLQYEEKYWWFEIVVIIQKMFMTGAMCVIAPGSYKKYAEVVSPWIVDGVHFVNDAYANGKRIITELTCEEKSCTTCALCSPAGED